MFCIIFSDRENHERKERRNYLTTVTQNQTIQTPLKVKYTGHEHQKRGKKREFRKGFTYLYMGHWSGKIDIIWLCLKA